MSEVAIEVLRTGLKQIRVPTFEDKVYKDECSFSFDTPESETGLYTSLSTFLSYGKSFVLLDHMRTGNILYLHQRWKRVPREQPANEPASEAPTKMAIGVEGGFKLPDAEEFDYEKTNSVVALQDDGSEVSVAFPNNDLPELIKVVVDTILARTDASLEEQPVPWQEEKQVSKYAKDLVQLDSGFKLSPNPKDWKCQDSGLTENLWLNLSTGYIGSGRKQYGGLDGTGAALKHYEDTGRKYPLVVKLGTITPAGADVYSYAEDEDNMVEDPYLAQHLAHWGINMMQMEKTEKSTEELNIQFNLKYEWNAVLEEGKELIPRRGPGYVGLVNLGNSCYANSLYQLLFALPVFVDRYVRDCEEIFFLASADPVNEVNVQMSKLGRGLYSENTEKLCPRMLKNLLGRGHREFSTGLQQDAHEYYQYLLTKLYRASQAAQSLENDVTKYFKFQVETRTECMQSNTVKYATAEDNTLSLGLPLETATNKADVDAYLKAIADASSDEERKAIKPVIPILQFQSLLQTFEQPEYISGFMSPVTGQRGVAMQTRRFATFPQYLVIQLRRYILGDDWTPKKLEANVQMPDTLDLSALRGSGRKENEVSMPDDGSGNGGGLATAGGVTASPEALEMLMMMGISKSHATKALQETNNDIERAADWCLSHDEEMDIDDGAGAPPAAAVSVVDGEGVYRLKGFITHLGSNVHSGHYVCHLKKDDKWILYNDTKVAESIEPPLGLGYIYLYERV